MVYKLRYNFTYPIIFLLVISTCTAYSIPSRSIQSSDPTLRIDQPSKLQNTTSSLLQSDEASNKDREYSVNSINPSSQNKQNSSIHSFFIIEQFNGTSYLMRKSPAGNILTSKRLNNLIFGKFEPFNSSTVLLTTLTAENYFWNYEENILVQLPVHSHHDIVYNPNKKTFLTLETYVHTEDDQTYLYDRITEETIQGKVIWSLNTSEYIPTKLWNGRDYISSHADITHANSLDWDIPNGKIYVNFRSLNQVYKFDYQSKQVDWILGENGDFNNFDNKGNKIQTLFTRAHDFKKVSTNKFVIFDNQYWNPFKFSEKRSRLLVISINTSSMNASIIREWVAPAEYYSPIWGNVQLLPNGNLVGGFGNSQNSPILTIISPKGKIIWSYTAPSGFYQVYLEYNQPVIQTNFSHDILSNSKQSVQWKVWYFSRLSVSTNASYDIYLNRSLVYSSQFEWRLPWRETNISYTLKILDLGNYNLTIAIKYGSGQISKIQSLIRIRPYFIYSQPAYQFEKGRYNQLMVKGKTSSDFEIELYKNSTFSQNFTWTPTNSPNLEFDITSFNPGLHNLSIKVYNGSNLIDEVSFNLRLYRSLKPQIKYLPNTHKFTWGNSTNELNWSIQERSQYNYTIDVNGSQIVSKQSQRSDYLQFLLSGYSEGVYQVELKVIDFLGNESSRVDLIHILEPKMPIVESLHQTNIEWGSTTNFTWEVHGGRNWTIFRDTDELKKGVVKKNNIIFQPKWRIQNWTLDTYNLSVRVSGENGEITHWEKIKIIVNKNNPYPEKVISRETAWVSSSDDILGEPDGEFAEVFFDYENGRITVEMGSTIINREEIDFLVHATGGTYRLLVSHKRNTPYFDIGTFQGNQSIDLEDYNYENPVNFVQIEYLTGDHIFVDSIQGLNFKQLSLKPPIIQYADKPDFGKQTGSILLHWKITGEYLLDYKLFINNHQTRDGYLSTSEITHHINLNNIPQNSNVTISARNILDMQSSKSVILKTSTKTSSTDNGWLRWYTGSMIISLLVIFGVRKQQLYRWVELKYSNNKIC